MYMFLKKLLGVVGVAELVFVCPECGAISGSVGERMLQEIGYVYYVDEDDFSDDYVETIEDKYYCLECGHELEGDVDDYVCIVDRENGIIAPNGIYWVEHVDRLREIAEKNGFVVDEVLD